MISEAGRIHRSATRFTARDAHRGELYRRGVVCCRSRDRSPLLKSKLSLCTCRASSRGFISPGGSPPDECPGSFRPLDFLLCHRRPGRGKHRPRSRCALYSRAALSAADSLAGHSLRHPLDCLRRGPAHRAMAAPVRVHARRNLHFLDIGPRCAAIHRESRRHGPAHHRL